MNVQQVRSLSALRRIIHRTVQVAVAAAAIASIAFLSLTPARPAKANANGYPFAKWLVTLSFPKGVPLVELTTQIWFKPNNGPAQLVISQTDELVCTVTGNLAITDETATFSGQEFIACNQPDMVQKIHQVSNGVLTVSPLQAAIDPYAFGIIKAAEGAPAGVILPVHHHPNIQYGVGLDKSSAATQHFRVANGYSISNAYIQAAPNKIRVDFRRQPNGSYSSRFTMNGATTPGNPATINGSLQVNLAATTIYFGYSPLANSYYQGDITVATIDPGVIGRD
jgi:hypothetical protein